MLVHECHETLLDFFQLFLQQLFLCLDLRQLLLHPSQYLSVGLQITYSLVCLKFVLFGLVCQPAHILLQLIVLCLEAVAFLGRMRGDRRVSV